jgi:tripartite-type tricarboxylate transporter receptor subunit TctC
LSDVIAGHVNMFLANLSVVLPHATSGAVRLLAETGEKRAPQLPNVPTFTEAGFPAAKSLLWTGLMAPTGTPSDIVERIAKEVKPPSAIRKLPSASASGRSARHQPPGNSPL